jgi:ABC-2 type transport system permease protein
VYQATGLWPRQFPSAEGTGSTTSAGLGLLVATYARNAGQVGMRTLLVVMPVVVLSGTYTPLESMPAALRNLMQISPLRHFIEIAYGILLRGAGWDTLWDSALAMALLGSGLFALGMWRFRRQFQ